tara:strand:+ start:4689 stop:4799 length:111 start_codon:yes stop_codon:yes gene_type:complete
MSDQDLRKEEKLNALASTAIFTFGENAEVVKTVDLV